MSKMSPDGGLKGLLVFVLILTIFVVPLGIASDQGGGFFGFIGAICVSVFIIKLFSKPLE